MNSEKQKKSNRVYQHSAEGKAKRKDWLKKEKGKKYKREAQQRYRKKKRESRPNSISINQCSQ